MKKLLKKILIFLFIAYAIYIFITQQHILNTYKSEEAKYSTEIANEEQNKKDLENMRDNINSPEYIEEIAREKLGMYLPNERVYIDVGK